MLKKKLRLADSATFSTSQRQSLHALRRVLIIAFLELQSKKIIFFMHTLKPVLYIIQKSLYFVWCPYQKEYELNTLETGWQQKIEL
jgi:hypothetical protein